MGLMLSSPRNPPPKMLFPSGSCRLSHQVKLSSSFWKTRSRKSRVRGPVDQEDPDGGDGVDRRVDVVEVPLVGRERSVRVQEPLPQHHDELVLGERGIEVGPGDGVEGQVPGREPRVLPGIGHGQDVEGIQVAPARVAPGCVARRRRRLRRVAVEPLPDPVGVELLAPHEARRGLAEDPHPLLVQAAAGEGAVELVRVALAPFDGLDEGRARPRPGPGRGAVARRGRRRPPSRPAPAGGGGAGAVPCRRPGRCSGTTMRPSSRWRPG